MTEQYSVIIPAYNAEGFLADCLESVFLQTTPPSEVICVDDGSSDATSEIARSYPVVTLIRQENQGCSSARNAALRVAASSVIAFCDADDVWLPEKMTQQLNDIEGSVAVSYCATEEFVSGLSTMSGTRHPQTYCLPVTSCVVVRKAVFNQTGLFDESIRDTEFIDWWSRVLAAGVSLAVSNEILVRRRIHATNKSRSSFQSPAEFLKLARRHRERMSKGTL
jgi:glycosyltransferase involved in cell wall biosynthesis